MPTNRNRLVCLILALITLLLYLPVQHFEFVVYDDPVYVQNNQIVQEGLTWHGVAWAFTGTHASNRCAMTHICVIGVRRRRDIE